MRFNIDDYPGNYAMHCKTKEQAIVFFHYLDSVGKTWCDKGSYVDEYDHKDVYPCYDFNRGYRGSVDTFINHHFTILSFDDFAWSDDWDDGSDWLIEELLMV